MDLGAWVAAYWWQALAWLVALVAGAYGAWRAWRTDRTQKLLGRRWEFVPRGRSEVLVTNRQPRTAFDVRVEVPDGHLADWPSEGVDLAPNEAQAMTVLVFFEHTRGPVTITWRHRPGHRTTEHQWRGHLPEHVYENESPE